MATVQMHLRMSIQNMITDIAHAKIADITEAARIAALVAILSIAANQKRRNFLVNDTMPDYASHRRN